MTRDDLSPDAQKLYDELMRTEFVWGNFIHFLSSGLNPERTPGSSTGTFRGSPEGILFAIFKVMDGQVRHIRDAVRALGIDPPQLPADSAAIYDEVAREAELL